MPKEWIDVADTAVKIGLGSLITGTFTYLGVKFSHNSEKKKFLLENKVQILESIITDSQEYFYAWNALVSKVAGITKHMEHDLEIVEFNTRQLKSMREKDSLLIDAWSLKDTVLSKLRLLKAKASLSKFSTCIKLEKELRDILIFEEKYPNYLLISEYRSKVKEAQKDFQESLSDTFTSIFT